LHEAELNAYKAARTAGIQPAATTKRAVDEAYRVTEMIGKPYDADSMPPTTMIPDQRTATAAKEIGMV
jgi:hypothetical protein